MSPETQVSDGFITYDELRGPGLDAARWIPARLPLPAGGEHIALDPNAELAVSNGEVQVTILRFSLAHSAKYLVFSTRQFELSPDRPATFAVDLAVQNIGGEPADYRRGMAAFHVFDPDMSKRVFAIVGTSTRVFAMHEQVAPADAGAGELFYHVIESPYEDFDDDFTRFRASEITLDRSRSTAAWRVDEGHKVHELETFVPERVLIGFGILGRMLPRAGPGQRQSTDRGSECERWRWFRVNGGSTHDRFRDRRRSTARDPGGFQRVVIEGARSRDRRCPTCRRSAATCPWKAVRPAGVRRACTRRRWSLTGRSIWT